MAGLLVTDDVRDEPPQSHYPYAGDSQDGPDRYTERRPADEGGWLLHGHVHHQWRVNGRQINVGVDVWDFAPVSAETLLGIIADVESDAAARP